MTCSLTLDVTRANVAHVLTKWLDGDYDTDQLADAIHLYRQTGGVL